MKKKQVKNVTKKAALKTKHVRLILSAELYKKVKELAKKHDTSVQNIVREFFDKLF